MISIKNQTHKKNVPNKKKITTWIKNITKNDITLNIIIVNKKKILLLNKKYKRKNKTTDILSFKPKNNYLDKKYIGDIFVCAKIIKNNAKQLKTKTNTQWCKTIIHGILHLLNYKHKTQKEFVIMQNLENKILKYILI